MAITTLRADSAHANSEREKAPPHRPLPPIEPADDGSPWAKAFAKLKAAHEASNRQYVEHLGPANTGHDAGLVGIEKVREEEKAWSKYASAYLNAVDELIATPAPTLTDAIFKLEIGNREEVFDSTEESRALIDCIIADLKQFDAPGRNQHEASIAADTNLSQHEDAVIVQAWERQKQARAEYESRPLNEEETPEDRQLWAIIDESEEVIRAATASTLHGAELQLWTALQHYITYANDGDAVARRDLGALETNRHRLDRDVQLIMAALRSMQALSVT